MVSYGEDLSGKPGTGRVGAHINTACGRGGRGEGTGRGEEEKELPLEENNVLSPGGGGIPQWSTQNLLGVRDGKPIARDWHNVKLAKSGRFMRFIFRKTGL